MKINLAVKCAQNESQLKNACSIAEDYGIHGIEIQELFDTMEKKNMKERAGLVVKHLRKLDIKHLAYHYPIKSNWNNIVEAQNCDLASGGDEIMNLSKETIKEAVFVASELKLKTVVPVNFHLFGFVGENGISWEEKDKLLKKGESKLIELKEYADKLCKKKGLLKNEKPLIQVTRENNPPDHGSVVGLLDYRPEEIVGTKDRGIKNCLDFAHLQQYINYLKDGNGEFKGVDLDKEHSKDSNLDWSSALEVLRGNIALVHINDAKGYRKEGEGLEVGKGEIDYSEIFPLLKSKVGDDIIYTVEIKDGHNDWEKVKRSISKIENIIRNA